MMQGVCVEDFNQNPGPSSGHWSFSTWLIIILFFITAVYLILSSWRKSNRYSAFCRNLVPHSEFIRDILRLLRNRVRRVIRRTDYSGRDRKARKCEAFYILGGFAITVYLSICFFMMRGNQLDFRRPKNEGDEPWLPKRRY